MTGIDEATLASFRAVLVRCLGLAFDEQRSGPLTAVLERRLQATRSGAGAYVSMLAGNARELRALAREITVNETYFFRHREQLRAFEEVALPARLAAGARPLRVLSAGCSSGEEAYTLAILLREHGLAPAAVAIRAADLSPAVLERAATGRYSEWSLRETGPEVRQRWFVQQGREFVLDADLRRQVTFEERNLSQDDPELWPAAHYDVVFCRNVIMYFPPEVQRQVVARVSCALKPGGYLFLGHAETLRGLSHDFALCHSHNTFYYERKAQAGTVPEREPRARLRSSLRVPLPPIDTAAELPWTDTVRQASERIAALCAKPVVGRAERGAERPTRLPTTPPAPAAERVDLGHVLELLAEERYTEALDVLGENPAGDTERQLLRAVLLVHSGETGTAEHVCRRLLEQDELNAGAHYVLALCREGGGDRTGAVDHDQTATYLDPTFAMPRLHLGLMARRAGEREAALQELGQAAALLEHEDSSRLLLFGGGFRREALIALCRSELGAAEGLP